MPSLGESYADVRERLRAAAELSGRGAESVVLLAVSKGQPAWVVRAAHDLGQRLFGENRVQEGTAKAEQLQGLPIEWHLVGPLQKNKVRPAVRTFTWIQSVDSLALLERLDRIAGEEGRTLQALVQVDLAGETTKIGMPPVVIPETLRRASDLTNVTVRGLMLLPPYFEQAERARPYFRKTAELLAELNAAGCYRVPLTELSMGMTHDFDIAVSEGATMVRVGTGIFGERPRPGTPEAM